MFRLWVTKHVQLMIVTIPEGAPVPTRVCILVLVFLIKRSSRNNCQVQVRRKLVYQLSIGAFLTSCTYCDEHGCFSLSGEFSGKFSNKRNSLQPL